MYSQIVISSNKPCDMVIKSSPKKLRGAQIEPVRPLKCRFTGGCVFISSDKCEYS